MMNCSRFLLLLSLSVLGMISGCATTPVQSPPAAGPVSDLTDWEFEGRAALRQKRRSWRVDIRWQQRADEYQISLMSLLGQQLARLHGRRGEVVLERPGEAAVRASSPAVLMTKEFGWDIPVQGLRYWVLGNSDPDMASRSRRDRYGYLQTLEQQGWRIEFDRYHLNNGVWLPGRLTMTRDGLSVRLVIDRWLLAGRGN